MAKEKKIRKTVPLAAVDELASQIVDRMPLMQTETSPKKSAAQSPNASLSRQSATLFTVAALIGVALGIATFVLDGGREGVPAIGGVLDVQIPEQSARIILLLDLLFPVFYGSGIAVLATSLQSRGNRPLVRLIMTSVLVVVTADFFENALVFNTLTGDEPYLLRWPLTVIKYAGLAFAGAILSAIIPIRGSLGWLVQFLLRYAFPVAVAVLVSGLSGLIGANVISTMFPAFLLLMAFYASQLSNT